MAKRCTIKYTDRPSARFHTDTVTTHSESPSFQGVPLPSTQPDLKYPRVSSPFTHPNTRYTLPLDFDLLEVQTDGQKTRVSVRSNNIINGAKTLLSGLPGKATLALCS